MNDEQIKNILELIDNTKAAKRTFYDKNDKINFAYQYWMLSGENSIEDLIALIAKERSNIQLTNKKNIAMNNEYMNIQYKLINFLEKQKVTQIQKFRKDMIVDNELLEINKTVDYIKRNSYWLSLYDFENAFLANCGRKNSFPVFYSYMVDGKEIKIDFIALNNIEKTLKENNVPIANCIVKESFHHYAFGSLNDYMKKLHKYDENIEKIKRHIR